MATAVFPIESLPETREAGQPVHRETRDVGVQVLCTHTALVPMGVRVRGRGNLT